MKYLVNGCTDAQWNMALDQFVLEQGPDEPVFWLWQNAPAVIIGRNQSARAEVNLPYLEANGITLARRVTGGGAVYHDLGNLNYSIAGPTDELPDAAQLMAETLRQLGVKADKSGRNDILVEGRKCSGYAKSIAGGRTLLHGTLMWDVDLVQLTESLKAPGSKLEAKGVASVRSRVVNLKPYLPYKTIEEFRDAVGKILAGQDGEIKLTEAQLQAVGRLADDRFRRPGWTLGKDPATRFNSSLKLPCGTVEAHYTLKGGVFTEIHFSGDFIGEKPAEELAQRLIGQRPEDLADVQDYFEGTGTEELLLLFQ
jgi:lipoate-protein ligase A